MHVAFNRPYLTGEETKFIEEAVNVKKQLSGNGFFTKECHNFLKTKYGFKHCLLTSSCTDALEMASILTNVGPGDEIIIPSFTFVSSANPFVLRGAKIVFADSDKQFPNISLKEIKRLKTSKTKVIVVVHYAGLGYEIDKIADYCKENNIYLVEDAAQSINTYFKDKPLGSFGDLSTFSFHETKNIISGEGGLLVINNKEMMKRAEIIWEKGTNRAAFYRGEVNKYGWVDIGSSFLPSELTSAFLYAQLRHIEDILGKRKNIWEYYDQNIDKKAMQKAGVNFMEIPEHSTNNYHIFYFCCKDIHQRDILLQFLKEKSIIAVFHYLSLHKSEFFSMNNEVEELKIADEFSDCLVRLPLFPSMTQEEIEYVVTNVNYFFNNKAEQK